MTAVESGRILEVCCADIESVRAACEGGASRIELCSALGEGGITPSAGLIRGAVACGLPVNVLIRPREGDFLYTEAEVAVMESDIRYAAEAGAAGVVIGALTPEGDVDTAVCRRLIEAAGGVSVTFHRAFDLCRDPYGALEDIVALGCDRILTSGQSPTALEGSAVLADLNRRGAGRVIILAGGGVTPENVGRLIALTGVSEVHASAKRLTGSGMKFRRGDVSMGRPGADEFSRTATDAAVVSQLVSAINSAINPLS